MCVCVDIVVMGSILCYAHSLSGISAWTCRFFMPTIHFAMRLCQSALIWTDSWTVQRGRIVTWAHIRMFDSYRKRQKGVIQDENMTENYVYASKISEHCNRFFLALKDKVDDGDSNVRGSISFWTYSRMIIVTYGSFDLALGVRFLDLSS